MTGTVAKTLPDDLQPRETWLRYAACAPGNRPADVDPDVFFPEKGASTRTARKLCASCPVVAACLEWAIARNEVGYWGGATEKERKRIKRGTAGTGDAALRRRRQAAAA